MRYPHNELFKFDFTAFKEWLFSKRPSLTKQKLICHFCDESKLVLYINMDVKEAIKYGSYN